VQSINELSTIPQVIIYPNDTWDFMKPAAVVLLRLFNVYNSGTDRQWEEEVQNYEYVGINSGPS
jgi:hypothetical protein